MDKNKSLKGRASRGKRRNRKDRLKEKEVKESCKERTVHKKKRIQLQKVLHCESL